jgi:hypothetical protein
VRRPDLPNELSAIIMRAIAADPERRYFTADELRVALDQFAIKSGLAASTSALGAYLRKQFGERPEPWLELEAQGIYSFDDIQIEESAPSNSWSDLPRDDPFRRSTGSIPRQSGPIGVVANGLAGEPTFDGAQPRQATARHPSTPAPTDSKMGWEHQQAAPAPPMFTPTKIAMIAGPLVVILGVAIWQLTGSSAAPPPPPVQAVAQPAPQAPPTVTPIPEQPRVALDPSVGEAAALPKDPPRAAEPPRSHAGAASAKRSPTKVADVSNVTNPSSKSKSSGTQSIAADVAAASPPATAAGSPPSAPPPTAPVVPAAVLPPSAPAPALPIPQQTVAPTALDANRIAGEKEIVPDANTQSEIGRAGVDKIVGSYKLCITAEGAINTVTPIKSTGFPAYDTKIQNTIRAQWKYRAFIINGKATPVCTAVRFIYSQK